jgi:hypothetical protein
MHLSVCMGTCLCVHVCVCVSVCKRRSSAIAGAVLELLGPVADVMVGGPRRHTASLRSTACASSDCTAPCHVQVRNAATDAARAVVAMPMPVPATALDNDT